MNLHDLLKFSIFNLLRSSYNNRSNNSNTNLKHNTTQLNPNIPSFSLSAHHKPSITTRVMFGLLRNCMLSPLCLFLLLFFCGTASNVEAFAPSVRVLSTHQDRCCLGFPGVGLWAAKSDDSSSGISEGGGEDHDDNELDIEAFKARKQQQEVARDADEKEEQFDGYALRDVIYEKWGKCYDVDFNRVDSFGFRSLYLNVLPFHLGGRRFRHESELDYLCHLQAVVEILDKYDQVGYVLIQIDETKKKPRAGTSPLVAVPLRLELTKEQVAEIIGY